MFKSCVFISGYTKELDGTKQLKGMLHALGFNFKQVDGCYKGVKEVSFKVNLDYSWQAKQLRTIAKVFNQESILIVNDGQCKLEFIDNGEVINLGVISQGNDELNYSIIDGIKYCIE